MNKLSINGTPMTMAPEVLKGENDLISYKSDIWSLGIIILKNILIMVIMNIKLFKIFYQIKNENKLIIKNQMI